MARKIIAVDIDGTLLKNSVGEIFDNNRYVSIPPFIKRMALRAVEIFEKLFRIKYRPNEKLARLLARASKDHLIMLITDRSIAGLKNVWPVINSLGIKISALQVRGRDHFDSIDSISSTLYTRMRVFVCANIKPDDSVLDDVRIIACEMDAGIILIDNHMEFLQRARSFGISSIHPNEIAKDEGVLLRLLD